MLGSPASLILSVAEMFVAMILFHRAIPSVIQAGRKKAFKIWALALCLGLFAVDQFTVFMNGGTMSHMTILAHVWLVVYGALRYAHIAGRGLTPWGETRDV